MASPIEIHPLSTDPTAAWREISNSQKFSFVKQNSLIKAKSVNAGYIRIVCVSDTHSEDGFYKTKIPEGDILIHAGDFTRWGAESEVIKFNDWMKSLPHKHKIVIAGNHEMTFDLDCVLSGYYRRPGDPIKDMKKLLTDCIYLEDSSVTLYGLKIYGSPWQPEHGGLAFNLPRGEKLLSKWNLIPDDTDILITHGPPLGYGDTLETGVKAGCVELLSTVQKRVKPKYHIFGHIHEDHGITTDGSTVFINASICNRIYIPKNPPIVVDVAIKYF